MSKIGIFGGSFNPIHNGHVHFINEMKQKLELSRIVILPSTKSPHKSVKLAPFEDRFKMCKLATKDYIYISVSDVEKSLGDQNQTIYALQKLKEKYPFDKLFLIVGPDAFCDFENWHKYRSILKLATLVSAYNDNDDDGLNLMGDLVEKNLKNAIIEKINLLPIRSTFVRIKLAQKVDCSKFLEKEVLNYILEKNLYCSEDNLILECLNASKNNLSQRRFHHCIAVAKAAKELAEQYNENGKDALIAGILHDILKEKNEEFFSKFVKKNQVNLTDLEMRSTKLWHSIIGAVYCEKVLGIENEKILSAIKCHTSAKKDMTIFDKILYLADCISEDRIFKAAKTERKLVKKSLDEALLFHVKYSIELLIKKESLIHPSTIECYNQLMSKKMNGALKIG